ncbi:MAG: nickel pincer cofactor biosynthesis protein LarC [Mycobacteriales bacterium]
MIGWLDCSAGISGDMLLGALVDAGTPLETLQEAVDAVCVEPVRLRRSDVVRGGIGACKVDVLAPAGPPARTWADVRSLLERAALPTAVRSLALGVFARLAAAEAAVHRVVVDDVHFHEVGALDALADVVGCAAGLHALGLDALSASTVTLGSGTTRGAHGPLPVPPPAVLALLKGVPVQAGPVAAEMTTPTGAALLATTVSSYGPLPPMSLLRTGSGAGGRNPEELANVLRLVLGDAVHEAGTALVPETALVLETNVDDLDPRLWPGVLQALLAAGASDAWLTPVLMKKGRPAHTLSVLCDAHLAAAAREVVFRQTSTLGLRETPVAKTELERAQRTVEVEGRRIRVKLGLLHSEVVNTMPEWEDVAAAAAALGRPVKQVLQEAHAAAAEFGGR